ncbi:MAG TPA: hypothetical protein PKD53_18125 [Chloroflexaceae bacterium]|nr:hypothetical protein [Chloroflexaceae bacterium]
MFETQAHQMELERTHPSGAEEWFCPTCGRRFLMHWPPNYKKIVLEPGDEHARHSGAKAGMQPGASALTRDDLTLGIGEPMPDPDLPSRGPIEHEEGADDSAPPPWLRWLEGYDPAAD